MSHEKSASLRHSSNEFSRYAGESFVHYLIVIFMLFVGLGFAWTTGETMWDKVGQCFGFVATTCLIIVVYEGLKTGKYLGEQRQYATRLYTLLMVDEGLTLFAKYHEGFREIYWTWIALSIPLLAYAAFKIIVRDEEMEARLMDTENTIGLETQKKLDVAERKFFQLDRSRQERGVARLTHTRHMKELQKQAKSSQLRQFIRGSAQERLPSIFSLAGIRMVTFNPSAFLRAERASVQLVSTPPKPIEPADLQLEPSSGDSAGKRSFR